MHDVADRVVLITLVNRSFRHIVKTHRHFTTLQVSIPAPRAATFPAVLAGLPRDDKARLFCSVNGTVRKDTQNDEILRFAAYWKQHSGAWPCELIFDSRLTTYANLARIDALGIRFITLRRRAPRILDAIGAVPREDWKRITLHNVARAYRNPPILEQTVSLSGYAGSVRQIAITGLDHDKPTLLITNQNAAHWFSR